MVRPRAAWIGRPSAAPLCATGPALCGGLWGESALGTAGGGRMAPPLLAPDSQRDREAGLHDERPEYRSASPAPYPEHQERDRADDREHAL